jgi:VWFA-related protein
MRFCRAIGFLATIFVVGTLAAQVPPPPQPAATQSAAPVTSPPPAATFKAASRMVAVEVVARDHQGHPSVADIAAQDKDKLQLPPGVYTNLVSMQKTPVPPTVLLVDGLNTELDSQMRVHQQMVRMLASIPEDVPVAVFLLGRHLKMIQNFTTDPKLLKTTLQKVTIDHAGDRAQLEPQDDPDALSAFLENEPSLPAGSLTSLEQFERDVYAMQMDIRVQETIDALRTLARHLVGYPGRKNLLWISSSFPIAINPDIDLSFAGVRNYTDQMSRLADALADAKISVYAVDPGGLQVQSAFRASTRMRGSPVMGPHSIGRQIEREDQSRFNRQATMQSVADQAGGIVCVNDNDLADCIRKAVSDSSSFYEMAYYPDSGAWQGEFHKIVIKSKRSGLRLAYRQGYFAKHDESSEQKSRDFQEAGCLDYLTSTSVLVVAKEYPTDKAGEAKFVTAVYPSTLNFVRNEDGSRGLTLKYAVCAFDRSGKPLQFMHQDYEAKFNEKEYVEVEAQHGLPHTMVIVPPPGTVSVRLLVQDLSNGQIGSVNVPYVETTAVATPPAAAGAATDKPTNH